MNGITGRVIGATAGVGVATGMMAVQGFTSLRDDPVEEVMSGATSNFGPSRLLPFAASMTSAAYGGTTVADAAVAAMRGRGMPRGAAVAARVALTALPMIGAGLLANSSWHAGHAYELPHDGIWR